MCHHSQVPTDSLGISFSVVTARGTGGLGQENGGGGGLEESNLLHAQKMN